MKFIKDFIVACGLLFIAANAVAKDPQTLVFRMGEQRFHVVLPDGFCSGTNNRYGQHLQRATKRNLQKNFKDLHLGLIILPCDIQALIDSDGYPWGYIAYSALPSGEGSQAEFNFSFVQQLTNEKNHNLYSLPRISRAMEDAFFLVSTNVTTVGNAKVEETTYESFIVQSPLMFRTKIYMNSIDQDNWMDSGLMRSEEWVPKISKR